MSLLRPLNKVPHGQNATVLIIGSEGVGKHDLAKALVDGDAECPVQIRTASILPLPEKNDSERPRIDFVVFMVDLTRVESMKSVLNSLEQLDARYSLGKSCFAITKVNDPDRRSVAIESLMEVSEAYGITAIFGELETEEEKQCLANRILRMVEVASGFKPNITPLLLETVRVPNVTEDL
ncbi:hypothetical protein ScPMuIL_005811 [Solemya velum]